MKLMMFDVNETRVEIVLSGLPESAINLLKIYDLSRPRKGRYRDDYGYDQTTITFTAKRKKYEK